MEQYEYFAVDYRTGKKQLKKQYIDDVVNESERQDLSPVELRASISKLKAEYKSNVKSLKKQSRRLEKEFRKQYGMMRRPFMADVFDVVEESRAVPNGRTPFNDEIRIEKDVVYKRVDGKQLCMDVYFPSRPLPAERPLLWTFRAEDG